MDQQLEEVYRRWSERIGIVPPIPLEDITRITSIMTDGFVMRQQIDRELDEELYGTMPECDAGHQGLQLSHEGRSYLRPAALTRNGASPAGSGADESRGLLRS